MTASTLRSFRFQSVIRILPVFLSVFLLSVAAFADSHARIVRLSYVDGNVEIDKGDGRGFSPAYLNMPVTSQSKLWARDGEAEVEFEDGSTARLTPDTILDFQQLDSDNNGDRFSTLVLQDGTAYFDVHHRDGDEFQVQFAAETLHLTHSAHFRIDSEKAGEELAVFSGEVQVAARGGSEVAVKKGETIRIDSDDPDRYQLAKGVDDETYDQWDSQRADDHQREVAAAATVGNDSGVDYGMADLNAYGNYFDVPGYGYIWRPNSMPIGWDPFADGYWMDYPGYGYMFVSGYPWGWTPYRYGAWQFVNGYGWCWSQGNNWATWQAVPPLRNLPPNYRPPRPPRRGGPGIVVVQNGVVSPIPARRAIIHEDNDSIARGFVRSRKIVAADGKVMPQATAPAAAPAQSLVGTQSAPASPAAPAPSAVSPAPVVSRQPSVGIIGSVPRRSVGSEGSDRPDRVVTPAVPVATVAVPAASPKPAAAVSPAPVHSVAPAPVMRAEPVMRSAPSAPAMRMPTHSAPAAPAMRMSMPSPAHASAPSGGGASHGGHH